MRKNHGLDSLKQRLRERGMVTTDELRDTLRVTRDTVARWRRDGRVRLVGSELGSPRRAA